MCSYNKTQVSPYDPTKLAILSTLRPEDDLISNCGQNFKKTVSLVDIVHFIDEDIETYEDFDCGITFYPETPIKIRQINRERNYNSRSCEKPKCIPSNDQHNYLIDEQHNSIIFLNLYNLWDMIPAALMSLNHTNDRYSMSTQYLQPETHQLRTDLYPVFSSLRRMESKRKGLRVSFAFFLASNLCLIIGHDVIITESLKSNYFSLFVANLTVSSRTLLNSIPYLRISMNKLGSDWLT